MSIDELIRGRRTQKAYAPEPVDRATLEELFELARWAPNHNLTNPWRFRVLGPEALAALKQAAGPEAAAKLDRAPTLIAASVAAQRRPGRPTRRTSRPPPRRRSSSCSARTRAGSAATGAPRRCCARPRAAPRCGIPEGERVLGLIHLGRAKGPDKPAPERAPVDEIRSYLD